MGTIDLHLGEVAMVCLRHAGKDTTEEHDHQAPSLIKSKISTNKNLVVFHLKSMQSLEIHCIGSPKNGACLQFKMHTVHQSFKHLFLFRCFPSKSQTLKKNLQNPGDSK